MTDLIVAGGGPAGLATALYAARSGLSVEVCEPRPGAVDKACGEGLMPGALAALQELGVDPSGRHLDGICYVAGSRRVTARFRGQPGRGVRRTTLHDALRDAVQGAGVEVRAHSVRDVTQDARGVSVDGRRARYLVAADGLHSPLRRSTGLEARPVRLRRYGLRRHYRIPPWTSYVEVHWADSVEAYVTPVGPDLVGVALLTAVRGSFDEHLQKFPLLRRKLTGPPAGPVMGAGPLRQRSAARVRGRVLLVGDAAGYVDALTGEGVALAVAQARAAVAALVADDPRAYEHEWHTVTRRYRLLTASLVGATRLRPLRRAVVPAAQLMPGVFGAAVNALARPA